MDNYIKHINNYNFVDSQKRKIFEYYCWVNSYESCDYLKKKEQLWIRYYINSCLKYNYEISNVDKNIKSFKSRYYSLAKS